MVRRKAFGKQRCFLYGWVSLLAVPPQKENLGLVPIGAAVFTMLADAVLNCKHARKAMVEIDWPVILMFYGWLAGFTNTAKHSMKFRCIWIYPLLVVCCCSLCLCLTFSAMFH